MREHYLRKELYELIKSNENIFDFIQMSSLDGLWYWDLENPENEWMNANFWSTLGYDPDQMPHLASAWQHIINQDDLMRAIENFQKHIEDPTHPYDQIVRYTHKNGSIVWIRCRGLAVRDEHGKPNRMLGAHHNITDIKEAEIEVNRKNEELIKTNLEKNQYFSTLEKSLKETSNLNQELESFSYSVAHDLRTPLRSVHGYAEMLNQDYGDKLDEEGKRIIGNIKSNISKMGQLIDDLLTLSRLGRKELQLNKVNMDLLTKDVITEINKSIVHQAKIKVGKLPEVNGDSNLIFQVMVNLISNAIKYTSKKENPDIQISSELKNGELIFSIKDNGVGFDMKYAEKLFRVFQRLHTEKEFEGTGIGLALVHRIIDKHGGKIWANAEVNVGATFSFILPNHIHA